MRGWEGVLGAAVGLVAGFALWGGDSGELPERNEPERVVPAAAAVVAPDRGTGELELLREQLADESRRRALLERRLAGLSAESAEVALASPNPAPATKAAKKTRDGWLDETALARAGFSPSEIEELRARFESIELKRLFIRDQAVREGWQNKPRFQRNMRALDREYDGMRDEYGDDQYDWLLFASGRNNRVVVERVMSDSEAQEVGLEIGDVFLRYDGEKIFDSQSLQDATSAGEFGKTVAVDVERNGERVRLYPARGPLGIGLKVAPMEPKSLY